MAKVTRTAILAVCIASAATAHAGMFNDLSKLTGKVVIGAGDARAMDCPSAMTYDCRTWPSSVYQMLDSGRCFQLVRPVCGTSCTGILALDRSNTATFFMQSQIGGDFTAYPATVSACPPAY